MAIALSRPFKVPHIEASFASDTNDWNPTSLANAVVILVSSSAFLSVNLTGLAGGVAGRLVWIVNVGGANITLKYQSTLSAAANRFELYLGGDITLALWGAAGLFYNSTTSRWQQFSRGYQF